MDLFLPQTTEQIRIYEIFSIKWHAWHMAGS